MIKFIKRLFIVVITIALLGFVFFKMVTFSGNDYSDKSLQNKNLLEKSKGIDASKGTLTIGKDKANELLNTYLKNGKSLGAAKVKAVKVDTKDDKLNVTIPVKYKDLNVEVSTNGKVSTRDDEIVYKIDSVKAGKMPVPKNILLNEIKKANIKNVYSSGDEIIVNKNISKIKIKNIKIENGNFIINY